MGPGRRNRQGARGSVDSPDGAPRDAGSGRARSPCDQSVGHGPGRRHGSGVGPFGSDTSRAVDPGGSGDRRDARTLGGISAIIGAAQDLPAKYEALASVLADAPLRAVT